MINLGAAAIAIRMLQGPVTLLRPPSGQYVNGEWREGAEQSTPIRAVIKPVSNADLERLPEGIRAEATHIIWTQSEIRAADDVNKTRSDVIVNSKGQRFRVIQVQERDNAGFFRAVGALNNDRGRSI